MSAPAEHLTSGAPSGRARVVRLLVLFAVVLICGTLGYRAGGNVGAPEEHQITLRARQYGYTPSVIRVNRGDTVHLRVLAEDVTHGFYLEGYDIDATVNPLEHGILLSRPSRPGEVEEVEEIVFTATRSGKFRYRCSQTCGFMHPFMLGELVVEPNRLFPTSVGIALGLFLGGVLIAPRRGRRQ